jgi:hypothetical protein
LIKVEEPEWPWPWLLGVSGAAVALVALILGLLFDRRGVTPPLALLALLSSMPVGALAFLLTRSW